MKGQIVVIPYPFTDLSTVKVRPVIVLEELPLDVLVAYISTKIPPTLGDEHMLIETTHPEFQKTGLAADSVIYLYKLATIEKSLIEGKMGQVGSILRKNINDKLSSIYRI